MDVPALSIQVLLRARPEWKTEPLVVVSGMTPTATVLAVNRRARACGVRLGQRISVALGRVPELRAGEVPEAVVRRIVEEITGVLHRFSPDVEPAQGMPGVFWVCASGLTRLFGSLTAWGAKIQEELARIGFLAGVAIGFSRFGTHAVARSSLELVVFDSPAAERERANGVGIATLNEASMGLRTTEALDKLGIREVGDLARLPGLGLRERFGQEAYALHQRAQGQCWDALRPRPEVIPLEATLAIEFPETDRQRLLIAVSELLPPLISTLRARCQAIENLVLTLRLDSGARRVEVLKTAQPTLDSRSVMELLRLRLESLDLDSGVVELSVCVEGDGLPRRQLELFEAMCRRNVDAANLALAKLAAELGEAAVVRARLMEGHLPRHCFDWLPLRQLELEPRSPPLPGDQSADAPMKAVRRLYDRPRKSAPPGRGVRTHGPYRIAGEWWSSPVSRDYYFANSPCGSLDWLYYDWILSDWRVEGRLE